jgi:Rhodopirellula transposase DDE domain
MLHDLGYSLQANSKTLEGTNHPDRNAQFEYLNGKVKRQLQRHQPVISVDTKKKELVGDFKNNGRELRPQGDPEKVRVHDFIIPELGRANPYGIYDIAQNTGWVSVGVDHDTAAFAVESYEAVVELHGAGGLSAGHALADYGGFRRQQRGAVASLES